MSNIDVIADFMGLTRSVEISQTPHGSCREIEVISYFDEGKEVKCNYETSWDSLMPVVIKINSFYDGTRPFVYGKPDKTSLIIKEKHVSLHSMFWTNPNSVNGNHWATINKKFSFIKDSPLEATFNSVVYFITWYNKNLKNGV